MEGEPCSHQSRVSFVFMSSLLGPFEKVKVELDFEEKALNDFQCFNGHLPSIVNTCDFLICITIAVTFVLVKRCFLIELVSSSSDERDAIQKKTFTKWVNKHLKKVTIDFYIIMLEWKTKTFLEKHQF